MRRLTACALTLLLACRPDLREAPPPTPTPATAPTSPRPPPPDEATAAPPATAPSTPLPPLPPVADELGRDLEHMIGGHFTPDHLGLDLHAAILARATREAAAYARRLTARHAQRARSDLLYADLYIATTLARLYPHAREPVEMSAREFERSFTALLQQPALDERQTRRIRDQQSLLHTLAGGLDRPLPIPPNPLKNFDRVCVSATPDGHGLTPELTCACGDQLACKLTATKTTLELEVHRLPAPPQCDDCYPTWTTCTVPRLPPGDKLRLTHAGRDLGTITVNASGWLPAATCLPAP